MSNYDYSTIRVSRQRGHAAMRAGAADWNNLAPHERAVDTIVNVLHAYYAEVGLRDLQPETGGEAILVSANWHFRCEVFGDDFTDPIPEYVLAALEETS